MRKADTIFDPSKPCFYCGEIGHWVPNCQVRQKALNIRAQVTPSNTSVASSEVGPSLESLEVLLHSGATHSVVGSISLFTHLTAANMSLSVASNQKLPVVGIGKIRLTGGEGVITINSILHC
ncbi:hypothetical protein O181_028919 [Austropuccinia psidii MF-1]|uniref:CCHC-type domain-containing protein n=1 Tax=Austropuccinia psidii MF-1 TaxID=1389203 RepID=A0A9Q3H431_9BASI|nr:hypothetical protein [Austropuccinia psidii MF-1]